MSRLSISFTKPNDDWLNAQVDSQEYKSKSDVVNDLIRQARREQEQIEIIRSKLIRAEQRGFTDQTPEQIREEVRKELRIDGIL
ncbi:ribbon-helix-helix domain-containing protein [Tunicatimonas pelagia]|uniref:ribbon-helix-helix domain-containing protein n=1 Tax=Tunicatimonas pelagia TaxID=931531 RepID=UPI002666E9F3|nr:CopG family transcriptional regulator [Tunicatimonas pelagia]WKN43711.1 CopG family transcriptional regulator [Tunicatimonas pelagia]